MDLLKQCQQWFKQDETQKVIDALEAIPAEKRTPELDSELAKAYIAIAEIGEAGRALYEKALELLEPHEEHFAEDHCWNYRVASAYYYLDEEGPALRYFERALEARPGDQDTQEYIESCRNALTLPRFVKNFRERTKEAWTAFARIEGSLRQIMDTDKTHQRGGELLEICGGALKPALHDTSFELGFNGEKHELNRSRRKSQFQDDDYICCSSYGRSRSKDFHWPYYKKLLKENNLPNIRWHDLRSTFCSLLLKNDFNPKAVSKLMGHAKEIITMDVYGNNRGIIDDCVDEIQPFIDEVLPTEDEDSVIKTENIEVVISADDYLK